MILKFSSLLSFSCGSFFSSGFGGCFSLCLGGSFSVCLGGSSFGALLGYFFCFSFILSCFGFEASLQVVSLFGFSFSLNCVFACCALCFPCVETTLSFSFVKSAFLNAALEMLHQEHAFVREDGAYGVGRNSTLVNPIQSPLEVQCYCSRISVRVVRTYPFNKSTISWCPAIGDYNRIKRIVLATMTLKSNFCCHYVN